MRETTFYIKTLGCKVNQYESQVIRERFLENGYIEGSSIDEANICIINTCTVTSTSDSKSLRLIRNAVKNKKNSVIATGCMVESENLDLSNFTGVRFIIKNKDKYRIPQIINRTPNHACPERSRGKPRIPIYSIHGFKGHTRVFVKVQDGCDNMCSYCKVRVVRGRSRSRPFDEVLNECQALIKNGFKELVLTGVCLGSYGRDLSKDINLSKLTREISKIGGDWRLRLSSIEPKDVTEDLTRAIQSQDKLCKHLHMPFQSGDNFILKKMNRPYKVKDYLTIVDKLRDAIPDIAISTDIMVGFPGETEKRFQNTLDFIKTVRPMRMHIFPFSRRKETPAYSYNDRLKSAFKKEREDKLLSLTRELSREFVGKFIDSEVRVLLEDKESRKGFLQGYTDRYIKVYIDGPHTLKGQFASCRLTLTNEKVYGILSPYSI